MLKAFLKYQKLSVNAHGVHSPFVYQFYNEVILKAKTVDTRVIEDLRRELKKDGSVIEILDLGAGSRTSKDVQRRISELTKSVSISKKYGQLLSRIIDFYSIENCLEMGTSMGLGTAYLASKSRKVITIEGCPNTYNRALKNLSHLNHQHINQINEEFTEGLKRAYGIESSFGLIYIDGNHQYKATLDYFNQLIETASNDTFLIFDDINWSEGMRKAWDEIVASDKINVSIELFRMGIVLKRKEQTKQHFILKF